MSYIHLEHLSKASGHPQFTSRTKILSIGLVPELVLRLGWCSFSIEVCIYGIVMWKLYTRFRLTDFSIVRYERYIFALEEASRDVLSTLKDKALKTIYALLKSKSEQERSLLSALMN
ncbi:hypothetical protein HanXRQr2_Chr04g0184591 [Helianthus annuus]|uniref:Uncharacterized protein n=1 Tax=Helianthus annuus TaxID=4232 RepID=A0A9K3JAZ0_HELAN|nr:hypothetical protein HanXRQr2_Chr04g0184591 [Helianthus annuus]